ncbi:hypothetical protein PoB_006862400 [Plakobranchus ocellatus]|uniref:Uncharacterized protein n=1 Tax=Plakobranchus ocellatus TaxID=259542 RepID=A0AAV4DDB2_9GAST|nr:hypothetical protein PoB_006862400 [Plakobranchus ocellatus]
MWMVKSNKVQNAALRLVWEDLQSTPITTLELACECKLLSVRRGEKLFWPKSAASVRRRYPNEIIGKEFYFTTSFYEKDASPWPGSITHAKMSFAWPGEFCLTQRLAQRKVWATV